MSRGMGDVAVLLEVKRTRSFKPFDDKDDVRDMREFFSRDRAISILLGSIQGGTLWPTSLGWHPSPKFCVWRDNLAGAGWLPGGPCQGGRHGGLDGSCV